MEGRSTDLNPALTVSLKILTIEEYFVFASTFNLKNASGESMYNASRASLISSLDFPICLPFKNTVSSRLILIRTISVVT